MEKVKLKNIDLNEDLESFKESCYKEIINNKEFYSLISEEFSNEEINKNISKFFSPNKIIYLTRHTNKNISNKT